MLSFDTQEVIKYLNFAALLIGMLAFVDFIIKFKRPLNFKVCFAALLFSLLFLDILLWLHLPFNEIVKFSPIINFGIWGTGLYTLSILTTGKIEKWVWWSSGLILLLNLYNFMSLMQHTALIGNSYVVFSLRLQDNFSIIMLTRYLQRIIMLISIVKMYQTIRNNKLENNIYQHKLIQWVSIFLLFVIVTMILNAIFTYIYTQSNDNYLFIIYNIFIISISILTIYRPAFLNSHNISKIDFKRLSLVDDLKLSDNNFYIPFFNNFYYLNKEASIEHFCKQNNIEEKESFNEQIFKIYKISFSNLINKKRVEYFTEIAKSPNFAHFSIEGLAKESGFSSRTALYKPFKKFHGGTPIDFINSLNN